MSTTNCPTLSPEDNSGVSTIVIIGISLASISTFIFIMLLLKSRVQQFNEHRRVSTLQGTKDFFCYMLCCKNDTRIWVEDTPNFIKFRENINKTVVELYNNLISFEETNIIELLAIGHNSNCKLCNEQLNGKICKTRCGHIFHKHCFIDWIRDNNNVCPDCENIIL
jgi:hypothetical protein